MRRISALAAVAVLGAGAAAVRPVDGVQPRIRLSKLVGDVTQCVNDAGAPGPCGPDFQRCGPAFGPGVPSFHIMDETCGENDPNFPLYDANHALYHAFYQDHLAEPAGGNGAGPVIGHAVSADMVHWAHLPVAVWNDQSYDNVAIYTGSATIVNGVPTFVYPGLCKMNDWPACTTGTVFAIALPANASDPLLTEWVKPSYNPIVEGVQRDPSTAWRTAAGEWRFTNYEGKVYSSPDFVSWREADGGALWPTAECPDFFTLPPACDGNGCGNATGTQPTHVHKQSSGGEDWYTLGIYTDGPANSTGNWTAVRGDLQPLDYSALSGKFSFYASKSFYDPVGQRRIYYGWAVVPPASTQTLPRVTTYHAGLQRLVFNPLPELSALREMPALYFSASVTVPSNTTMWLGDWPNSAGNQSEIGATLMLPSAGPAVTFAIGYLVGNTSAGGNVSNNVIVSFDPASFTANLTVGAGTSLSYYMVGTDLPGADYNVTNVNYTDPHICQSACTADPKCAAYTYVVRPPLVGSCCLKGSVPAPIPNPPCTSGAKPGRAGDTVSIPLLPGDTAIDVRIFVDNTFAEIFVMGGRVAYLAQVDGAAAAGAAGVTLSASGAAAQLTNVNVWHMNSIWVTASDVLEMRATRA